jgi:DNA-binding transcriptional regulator GbsR (MarR family)
MTVMGLTSDEREFIDRMGLYMERVGGPRTMGRLYGWLLVADPPHQSITELAATLEVSKASISTTARMLQEAGMIERFPAAKREHRYRITPGGWMHVIRVQLAGIQGATETLDLALAFVRPEQRAQLEETRDFFAFIEEDAANVVERWKQFRNRTSNDRSGT